MTWRTYASGVVISAGVFVTGVLWHQRDNPHIAAEDIAALTADVWERTAAFFSSADADAPAEAFTIFPSRQQYRYLAYESNLVSTVRARLALERIAQTLKRLLIPGHPYSAIGPDITPGEGPIHWLPDDTCFQEGNNIGESATIKWTNSVSVDYYGVERRKWVFSTDRDTAIPRIITIDTRDVPANRCYDFLENGRHVPGIADLGLSGKYGELGLDGANSWWEAAGLGDNLYVWPHFETAGPYIPEASEVTYAHHQISTNTLNDFRTVMSGMKTAVLIAGARNNEWWTCGTNSFRTVTMGFDGRYSDTWGFWPNLWTNSAPDIAFFTGPVQDLLDEVELRLNDPSKREPCPGVVGFPFVLYDYVLWRRWFLDYYEQTYGNPPGTKRGYIARVNADAGFAGTKTPRRGMLSEVRCAWPAPSLYTNGLVSRVRYYAVFGEAPTRYPVLPATPHEPPVNWFYYSGALSTNDVDSWTFSWVSTPLTTELVYPVEDPHFGYKVSYGGRLPLPLVASEDGYDEIYHAGRWEGDGPQEWFPVLLADVASPTEAPVVDIGTTDNIYVGAEMVSGLGFMSTDTFGDTNFHVREESYGEGGNTARSLALWALICVVDFNFSNYSAGGKGEAYTPPWAMNAPALP